MSKYDDIINLPHYQSVKRPHMSIHDRAAQFAPFAALKGYEEAVIETARLTDSRIILDENEIEQIDAKLQYLAENINDNSLISVTHFVQDRYKAGGEYVTTVGKVKRVDSIGQYIVLDNEVEILVEDIISLNIE